MYKRKKLLAFLPPPLKTFRKTKKEDYKMKTSFEHPHPSDKIKLKPRFRQTETQLVNWSLPVFQYIQRINSEAIYLHKSKIVH